MTLMQGTVVTSDLVIHTPPVLKCVLNTPYMVTEFGSFHTKTMLSPLPFFYNSQFDILFADKHILRCLCLMELE